MTHELKTWPKYFEMVWSGRKRFEVRKNDRNFQVGDLLVLKEFDPEAQEYSGRELDRRIADLIDLAPIYDAVALTFVWHGNTVESDLRRDLAEAKEQLEFDRTQCAIVVTALGRAMDSRFWLTEGRGSYAWDDDRYRQEFKEAAEAILAAVAPIRGMAINMASRLESTGQVIQARIDLKAQLAELAEPAAKWKAAMREAAAMNVTDLDTTKCAILSLVQQLEDAREKTYAEAMGKTVELRDNNG